MLRLPRAAANTNLARTLGAPAAAPHPAARALSFFEQEAKKRQIRKPKDLSAPIGADKIAHRAVDDAAIANAAGVDESYVRKLRKRLESRVSNHPMISDSPKRVKQDKVRTKRGRPRKPAGAMDAHAATDGASAPASMTVTTVLKPSGGYSENPRAQPVAARAAQDFCFG